MAPYAPGAQLPRVSAISSAETSSAMEAAHAQACGRGAEELGGILSPTAESSGAAGITPKHATSVAAGVSDTFLANNLPPRRLALPRHPPNLLRPANFSARSLAAAPARRERRRFVGVVNSTELFRDASPRQDDRRGAARGRRRRHVLWTCTPRRTSGRWRGRVLDGRVTRCRDAHHGRRRRRVLTGGKPKSQTSG